MRLVVQRVTQSSVKVEEEVVGKIGKGLCVLVGIHRDDVPEDAEYLARKLASVKLWKNEKGKDWSGSCKTLGLEILLVSQFTLYGQVKKGTKPDFHYAMKSAESHEFFNTFVELVGKEVGDAGLIQTGSFGEMMMVELENDGPVTLVMDSELGIEALFIA
eukprot:TRINITY_DN5300_c0_g2_i1.p2 TRINITY_DN5300_c0_g2~~TRINITY_DN5300_c0_g2_i1.p2  ORF type:complete len:160 (-),score=49.19 TRINITY_DN5300_c0_g2_i1:5-484(-)